MRTLVAGLSLGAGVGLGLLQRSRLAERTLAVGRRSSRLTHTRPFSVGTKGETRTAGGEPAHWSLRTFTATVECQDSEDGGKREAVGGFPQQKDYCLLQHLVFLTGCQVSAQTNSSIYSKAPPCS